MHIDVWTLLLQTVNVLVLVWILGRFLFRPLARIVAERQAEATRLLDDAEAGRKQLAADRAAVDKALAEARDARAAALKAVEAEAEREKAALIAAARKEADAARQAARDDAARLHAEAVAAAGDRAAKLAADIARRLLDRLPDSARIDGFIPGLGAALADLPPSARAAISDPVRIKAARALTEAETAALTDAVSHALGRPATLSVAVDPSLIAGLEIDAPDAVVRNHFRADLDRILKGLTDHDGRQP